MQILLVEDDPLLGDGIKEGLIDAGFTVEWLRDGMAGWHALSGPHQFDLLLLDINLPRLDGLSLLQQLRERQDKLPVLLLTARDQVHDRVAGLNQGADDYLVKPFALAELVARCHALLRRAHGQSGPLLRWRGLQLNPASQHVALDGVTLDLTATEYRLLHLLLINYPHYLSRTQLEEKLFGWQSEHESNPLDVHLSHLRKKLGSDAICNQRGLGWRMAEA